MKNITLCIAILLNITLLFSQQKNYKRITITNPDSYSIKKLTDIGIDLQCGAILKNNTLQLELSENELENIKNERIPYKILINDLTTFYGDRSKTNLPLAISELENNKAYNIQANKIGKGSKVNTLFDNLGQYNECDEIDWAIPANFKLGSMGGCLTVSETLAELDLMRSLYPNLISVKTDASPSNQTTVEGRTTYYVRISDNPDVDENNEPETLYTGMTHSREVSSLMNLTYYMWYILENYATDPAIKRLVDNQALYFIPIVNSDGLAYNESVAPNGGGLQRKNRNIYSGGCSTYTEGVDLNRNFGYYWGNGGSSSVTCNETYRGPTHFSEPESQIIRDFFLQHDFELVLNHHSFKNAMLHGYAGVNPNTLDAAGVDRREDEFAKYNHDMTHFNRYAYGPSTQISALNSGNTNDWMMGPAIAGSTGGPGAGKNAMAWTPENGSGSEAGGTGSGFWPNPIFIDDIAKRAMRANFLAAYYSGKYAKLIDLSPSNIDLLNGNLNFGIEFLGQTESDFSVMVTPVSSNILSITNPTIQTGMTSLEQRNVSVAYTLNGAINVGDEIEFKVALSNDDSVLYEANIKKYYNPTVLIQDNPDTDALVNWTASGSWGTTTDAFSGSLAITDSPSGSYGNNQSKTLQLNTSINTNSLSQTIIQFYAKWDLERSFDYVQIEASTNGSSWTPLCGTYTKPGAPNANNTYSGKSTSNNNFQPDGEPLYDGDTQDKWVMEEIVIDASNNSVFNNQSTVFIRFNFNTDSTNNQDSYSTTFNGFLLDDFRVIGIETLCAVSVPTALTSSNITTTEATITWDNIPSTTYDLRYRVVGEPNWTDITGLSTPTTTLTGLALITDYEVQVRSNCGVNNSAYSALINFTTLDVQLNYCDSASTNVNDEFISRVQINTIDNSSGAQFYSDFTSISTTLNKESEYTITVTPTWTGQVYNEAYSVWIDYNRDGDFGDVGEQVFTQGNTQATSVSGSFTIPSTAVENSTRMRVSMKYNGIPTSCETFQYGEVEDYTVVIEGSGPDIVPPIITLIGASPIDINVDDVYIEEGATALDDIDGDITANIVTGGIVDTNTGGTYIVTYDVSDAAGNPATQVVRTVNVIPDTTAPVITLIGNPVVDISIGGVYTEEGATALDDIDGDITANIVTGGTVDTNTGGTYIVTYDVSDAAGNPAAQVVRTVNVIPDTTAPVITLVGNATINLNVGDTYTEQSATAADNIDGDITANVVIGGNTVDTNIAGAYVITYDVSDAAGNAATQVERTVIVTDATTATILHEGYFEAGWDGWSDGGSDCARRSDAARSYEGNYSIRIRDNSGTASSMTSPSFNLTPYNEVEFSFYFYANSMENNEDFWLQYNDGSGFTTIATWTRGTDFNNGVFSSNILVILNASQYNLSSNAQFRLRCDASGNNDQIYIDQVVITGTGSGSALLLKDEVSKTETVLDVTENTIIKNKLTLYPNPVGDILSIKTSNGGKMTFRIINSLGQIVNTGKTSKEIIVDKLEAGMYFIEVTNGTDKMLKRFIKE